MIPIDVDRLRGLYAGVQRRSLRLETRQAYVVPWEDEGFAAWLRGDPEPPSASFERHLARCREVRESGRRMVRVRFVELPMTDYSRYEFETGYSRSTKAGEEILVIDRGRHPELDHVRDDFVVFDDNALMYYRYSDDDQLIGYDYNDDPAVVARHLDLAEEVLAVASPFALWSAEGQ